MTDPDDRIVISSANLRDLGGVTTVEGRTVRRGHLFRSGYLSELDASELDTLGALGLRTIVDLRRPTEVQLRPNPELSGVRQVPISVSADDNEFAVIAASITDPDMAEQAHGIACEYYRQCVVDRIEAYRQPVTLAVDDGRRPLLFHCTAGKDRTGVVAAILLKLLGVDDDTVVADYVLTNEVRRDWLASREQMHREQIAAHRGIPVDDVTDGHLVSSRAVLRADPAYIRTTLEAVTDGYGDWHGFAERGLGIGPRALDSFRNDLLD